MFTFGLLCHCATRFALECACQSELGTLISAGACQPFQLACGGSDHIIYLERRGPTVSAQMAPRDRWAGLCALRGGCEFGFDMLMDAYCD